MVAVAVGVGRSVGVAVGADVAVAGAVGVALAPRRSGLGVKVLVGCKIDRSLCAAVGVF